MNAPLTSAQQEAAYLSQLGERVRAWRGEHSMTRKALSQACGLSERYLAQLEAGRGNISVLLLRRVARAMGLPVEQLAREDEAAARGQRIALIGLRGAGKSTLGVKLAQALDVPFVELDKEVEKEAGAELGEVFAMYGQDAFRRFERRALERVLARQLLDGQAHRLRHPAQQQHGDVSASRFELREIALGNSAGGRQRLARHAVLVAPHAHAGTKLGEIGGFLLSGGERRVHEL